jgi:hypothetical protein
MMLSVPARAPMSPPLTGASSASTPILRSSAAIRRVVSGLIVLLSIVIVPARAPSMIPSGPSTTCSTSGESGRLVKTNSLCAATSRGDVARIAPSPAS